MLIYELLDEIIDYGYPQILEIDVLKKYITQAYSLELKIHIYHLLIYRLI